MVFILVLAFTPQSNVTGTLVSLVFVIKMMRMMGMTMMRMVMMMMVMVMRMVMRMRMRMMMMMKIDINDVLDDITLHTLGSGGANV